MTSSSEQEHSTNEIPKIFKLGKLLADSSESVESSSNLGGLETSKWAASASMCATPADGSRTSSAAATFPAATAQLNDVGGFMAAVRSLLTPGSVSKVKEGKPAHEIEGDEKSDVEEKKIKTKPDPSPDIEPADTQPRMINRTTAAPIPIPVSQAVPVAVPSSAPMSAAAATEKKEAVEEDREYQTYFTSWGPAAPRNTPRSQRRKVILSGIPAWLKSPTKILSLIHGGRVESLNISPTGTTAQVMFCNPAACRRFYDTYPNGLDVTIGRNTAVIFVDMDNEPDVMGSRIREALDQYNATRVLRVVGADMNINMTKLVTLAEEGPGNVKVEKIIDIYAPSTAGNPPVRTVIFRFGAIDHALRFRMTLSRLDEWEQANIQWGADPCEGATGFHWN